MELRYLRTFLAVAETLNISAAARRLRVTQPALSRHIQALEQVVGHPLFVRHRNGLRLTATGVTLRDQGMKALTAVDEALRSARGAGSKDGTLVRVGYYGSVSIWASLLAPALEMLGRKFPHATLSVVEQSSAQLVADLREGVLDVALLGPGDYGRIPGIQIEVACTVPAMAVVASNHRLAKKRQVSLEDIRHEEIIGVRPQVAPGRFRTFIAACRSLGFSPRIVNVASSFPELIMAVKKRMGVTILGSLAASAPHPGVVFIKLNPRVPLDIHAAHTLHGSPAALHLVELIVAEARRATEAGDVS